MWRAAMRNYCGDQCADHLARAFPEVPADALARRVVTLENLKWTKRVVGGKVEPSRCNFSSCAVGDKIVIFGGAGLDKADAQARAILGAQFRRAILAQFCERALPSRPRR